MRTFTFLFFFLSVVAGYSQQQVKGTVVDKQTKKSIPFASLKWKASKIQSIANLDGHFTITEKLLKDDSLVISCVGYKSTILTVDEIRQNPNIELEPVIYQLSNIEIISKGNVDYPYQLFDELCKKYRTKDILQTSKGYLCFLSVSNELPLELLEEYFNSSVSCKNGVTKLSLKNGRLGSGSSKFYSLSTTDLLTNFSLFSLSGNQNIPSSPGNFTYHGMKKKFELKIIKHY